MIEIEYKGTLKTFQTEEMFNNFLKENNLELDEQSNITQEVGRGVIPELLSRWFQQRKDMRKKAAEFKKLGNMELYNFYNQRQTIYKVLLNSFYGVLGLPVFRFYDIDNALAVTSTGVDIIQTTGKVINKYYSNKFGKKYKIIYDDMSEEIVYENQNKLLENGCKIKDIIHT